MARGDTATVTMQTSRGAITIKVEGALGPSAAGNFVALARCGFYEGVTFHRLVPGFVIQGGDPKANGTGGPGYTIDDDPVTTPYARGVVAMARTLNPHSAGSQFFIVLDDAARPALADKNNYAIFGRVTAGMATVDAIAAMPNSGNPANQALQPVQMTKLTVSTP
jgi:peptidyl-prolyl cis-trans isomerase B (cyclophilin B)